MTSLTAQPADADGLRGLALVTAAISIYIAMVCANLDMAIVQNALPAMSQQMQISSSASVWIITLYMLVTLTLLLPFAPLSDRIGYRRFFLIGLVIFTVGSLLCGLSHALWQLQIGRLLQGIGSAATMCTTTSLIRIVYPKKMMAKAIGSNSTVIAVSFASAPSLSAFILLHASWHWLFLINVPLGLLAMLMGWKCLPDNPSNKATGKAHPAQTAARSAAPVAIPRAPDSMITARGLVARVQAIFTGIDWLAVALNIGFFTLLLFGTDAVATHWPRALGMLAVAALLGWWFVRKQIGQENPMLPFDLLGQRQYALTIATSFGSFAAQGSAFVALPFYLQRTAGFDAAHTALIMTAWPLALAVSSQLAARLTDVFPIAYLCAAGQALMTLGLGLIASQILPATLPWLVLLLALTGAGFGLFQSPNNYVIVASAPPGKSGSVAALRAATRVSGQLIGSALTGMAFLFAQTMNWHEGPVIGILVAATMAGIASVCSISRTPQRPPSRQESKPQKS